MRKKQNLEMTAVEPQADAEETANINIVETKTIQPEQKEKTQPKGPTTEERISNYRRAVELAKGLYLQHRNDKKKELKKHLADKGIPPKVVSKIASELRANGKNPYLETALVKIHADKGILPEDIEALANHIETTKKHQYLLTISPEKHLIPAVRAAIFDTECESFTRTITNTLATKLSEEKISAANLPEQLDPNYTLPKIGSDSKKQLLI